MGKFIKKKVMVQDREEITTRSMQGDAISARARIML
jgi:hypothetical protein